jgi:ribosomal-protein-alanine N-acetyltransferase
MIREMARNDAPEVERVLAASPGASLWTAADLLSLASRNTRIWVAEEDKNVVGVVAARTVADEAEILNLAVAPAWRRRGVGRELMAIAVAESARAGAVRVFLEVRESNEAARAFYACLGFLTGGRRPAYYRNPVEDALVLARLVG